MIDPNKLPLITPKEEETIANFVDADSTEQFIDLIVDLVDLGMDAWQIHEVLSMRMKEKKEVD